MLSDGLVYRGTLLSVSPVVRRGTGEVIEGLARAQFSSSKGLQKLDLKATDTSIFGTYDVPAFSVLTSPDALGKTFEVVVSVRKSGDFVNTLAVDARVLSVEEVN